MVVNKTVVLLVLPPLDPAPLHPQTFIALNTAGNFAVLAGTTVHNIGITSINGGDVGTSHGKEIIGFPPGSVMSPNITRGADAVSLQAHCDLTIAYRAAAAMTSTHDLSGQDLGGMTLLPGVYFFASSAELNGTLTLKDQDDPNTQFIFQIGTTLTTGNNSTIISINGAAQSWAKGAVFWKVGSSASLGKDSVFIGNILAYSDITLNTDASIQDGSALTKHGKVTLDSNKITKEVPPNS